MDLQRVKQQVKSLLKREGTLRRVTALAHGLVIREELLAQRVLDAAFSAPKPEVSLADVTAVVKTFERPRLLRRLLLSIRRMYPRLAIIVVDDSKRPST